MRRYLQLAAILSLTAAQAHAQIHVPQITLHKQEKDDLSWLWQYTQPGSGSRETQMLGDPRFKPFLSRYLTAPQSFWKNNRPLSEVAAEFLAVPGQVTGDDNRYITADGCVQDFCPNRGLLWVDLGLAHPRIVFVAIDWITENRATDEAQSAYTMWVFSNRAIELAHIPQPLTRSIARWTSQPSSGSTNLQNITRVFVVDPDGTPHPVTPSTIGAHNTLAAETNTEPETSATSKAQP